jgi:hypothetical protein
MADINVKIVDEDPQPDQAGDMGSAAEQEKAKKKWEKNSTTFL